MTVAAISRTKLAARAAAAVPPGVVRFPANDRDAWLAMRKVDVTASVAAALLGEHPFATRFSLYALKTGQIADVEVEPSIEDRSISLPPMLRGTVLEPLAPQMIGMLRPSWSIEPSGWYYREEASRIGATPDLIAVNPDCKSFGIIQVKTTDQLQFRKTWKQEDGTIQPPMFIAVQAVVEAILTGAAWAEVAVIVSGMTLDLHLIEIPLHLGIMTLLRAEVAAFWRGIEAGAPPPPDHGRDAEVLAAMYPLDNGQQIDLTGINHLPDLLVERDQLKAEIKKRSDRVDEIDTELKSRLGNNEAALVAGGRRITWRTEQRRSRFVFASESRVLRVSGEQ